GKERLMLEHLVRDPRKREQIRNAGWEVVFDQLQLRLSRRGHSRMLSKFYQQATVHFALWSAKRHRHRSEVTEHGASLKEIADVLRNRYLDTTTIYTKVDLPRLAAVAAPWPKGGG